MKTDEHLLPSKSQSWRMFDEISPRYDLLNRILSFGLDRAWRRRLNSFLGPKPNQEALDLATGTADVLLALSKNSNIKSGVGVDLADKMLNLGKAKIQKRQLDDRLTLQHGDILDLPFPPESFDIATIAFGIRNVPEPHKVLKEMFRVLRKGGRALVLEFSLPPSRWLRFLHLFYLRYVVPFIGFLLTGHARAYRYLNQTIEDFPFGQEFCSMMLESGFQKVTIHPLTFGIATIYEGDKLRV